MLQNEQLISISRFPPSSVALERNIVMGTTPYWELLKSHISAVDVVKMIPDAKKNLRFLTEHFDYGNFTLDRCFVCHIAIMATFNWLRLLLSSRAYHKIFFWFLPNYSHRTFLYYSVGYSFYVHTILCIEFEISIRHVWVLIESVTYRSRNIFFLISHILISHFVSMQENRNSIIDKKYVLQK